MHPFEENKQLREFVAMVTKRSLAPILKDNRKNVEDTFSAFADIMSKEDAPLVYGVNKLPGHRDRLEMPPTFFNQYQRALIDNHCLPFTEAFDSHATNFVTAAKIYSIAAGGSVISPDLYDILLLAFEDTDFSPPIARQSSYSSGDVIPAAHWAAAVLDHGEPYSLKPGEGMALINGSFVHLGLATYGLVRLNDTLSKFLITSQTFFRFVSADDAFFEYPHADDRTSVSEAINFISEFALPPEQDKPQSPVTVRATPQILDGFISAISMLAQELDYYLFKPSGNPQVRLGLDDRYHIVPSGSFVSPSVTLATGQVIDALLMVSWHIVRRMEFFLSGEISGIPEDAANDDNPLGLIQWPKLAAAKLEDLRRLYGRRVFASGASTSYGVEDFWTQGLSTTDDLIATLTTLDELLALEYAVYLSVENLNGIDIVSAREQLIGMRQIVPPLAKVF